MVSTRRDSELSREKNGDNHSHLSMEFSNKLKKKKKKNKKVSDNFILCRLYIVLH